MRIDLFELERNQSIWENTVKYNLTESGLHPFTLREILVHDEIEALLDLPLGYGHTEGEPALRAAIASLHPGAGPENVLVTTGSSEANMLTVMSTLELDDEAIIITPTFMQAPGLAKALGAKVHLCPLRLDRDRWILDFDELGRKLSSKTRLISLCNPNNPTGSILGETERTALVAELAGEHPPQLALRLRQMRELGIFGLVADAVDAEITAATAALQEWPGYDSTPLLLGLCDVLKTQVASLRPPA